MFKIFEDINQDLVLHCMTYVSGNDPQHQEDHIADVALNGIILATKCGINNYIPFKLAALIHDMFVVHSRPNHHTFAEAWARENLPRYGYEVYAELVAGMCENHRDSGNGEYRNIHEEIFAAADRGPLTIRGSVGRAIGEGLTDGDSNIQLMFDRIKRHLASKFGRNGYCCPNAVHDAVYGRQVEAFKREINHLTFEQFEFIYKYRLDKRAKLMSIDNQYEMFMGV